MTGLAISFYLIGIIHHYFYALKERVVAERSKKVVRNYVTKRNKQLVEALMLQNYGAYEEAEEIFDELGLSEVYASI